MASSRAQAGGGREVALSSSQTPVQDTSGTGEWFGPGRALPGMAPEDSRGRRMDYMFGTNYQIAPRQQEMVTFQMLRVLADAHDLTRLAIETCKDRMVRLPWGFRILDSDEDMSEEQKARALSYRTLLRRPDGKRFWVDWLRMLLEDLLVIDAPSIFVRRTMDETEIVSLNQIDGATIRPVIDQFGNEPEPPETAYQQVLHGMPAMNYTSQQLIYRPRNQRVHKIWGYSPVEQIIATINIALRRQLWQHSYFTNGNIPDALIGVPSTWTPDQIREFQDWFDGLLQGQPDRRRNGIFVPGEVAKSYVPTKEAELFGTAEEWLARVVCFCFGIPHQALVKEVNRATADNAHEQAIEDGLAPVMMWVKGLMDSILIDHFGETELEFWWIDDAPVDPKVHDDIWRGRVDAGMANRNEWRTAVGMDPREEDEADMLLYQGKPLGVDDQIGQQERRNESGVFPSAVGGDGEDSPQDGVVASGGDEGGEEDGEEDASKNSSPELAKMTEAETQRWLDLLGPERRLLERRRVQLQRLVERALARSRTRVVAVAERVLDEASKAVDPGDYPGLGDELIAALGSIDFIIDDIADILEEVADDTSRVVLATIGPDLAEELVDQVSALSVAEARERAAELVGRRVLPDGTIIDNPDARWAITQTTRDSIRDTVTRVIRDNRGSAELIRELEDSYAFSPARAEMVSRTEIAGVNSRAAMTTYHAATDAGVDVRKRWVLGPRPCEVCIANAAEGAIPLDQKFSSGHDSTPAHPQCVCATIPEVGDGQ